MAGDSDVEGLKKEIEKREKALAKDDPDATLKEIAKALADVKSMKKDSTTLLDS